MACHSRNATGMTLELLLRSFLELSSRRRDYVLSGKLIPQHPVLTLSFLNSSQAHSNASDSANNFNSIGTNSSARRTKSYSRSDPPLVRFTRTFQRDDHAEDSRRSGLFNATDAATTVRPSTSKRITRAYCSRESITPIVMSSLTRAFYLFSCYTSFVSCRDP